MSFFNGVKDFLNDIIVEPIEQSLEVGLNAIESDVEERQKLQETTGILRELEEQRRAREIEQRSQGLLNFGKIQLGQNELIFLALIGGILFLTFRK